MDNFNYEMTPSSIKSYIESIINFKSSVEVDMVDDKTLVITLRFMINGEKRGFSMTRSLLEIKSYRGDLIREMVNEINCYYLVISPTLSD